MELVTPNKRMPYEKRNVLILLELLNINADIICLQVNPLFSKLLTVLQEVEIQLFRDLFKPQLAVAGYSGIHAVKPMDVASFQSSRAWGETRLDGCAIFWKKKKYTIAYLFLHRLDSILRIKIAQNYDKQFIQILQNLGLPTPIL